MNEDKMHEQRWIEIQFYYLLKDLLAMTQDIFKTLDWIDALAISNAYNPTYVKQYAMEFLQTPWVQPSKEEVVVLGHNNGMPIATIKRWTGLHNKTFYNILKRSEEEPPLFIPRYKAEQVNEIRNFLTFFEKLRRLGV